MWIQVRSMDGKKLVRVDGLSKLTRVEELREKLVEPFDASAERQRLFYRGKQLEDSHTLYDYDVKQNDIVQIMIKPPAAPAAKDDETVAPAERTTSNGENGDTALNSSGDESSLETSDKENKEPDMELRILESTTYKLGDVVDARDVEMGAWFEASIVKIAKATAEDNAAAAAGGNAAVSAICNGHITAVDTSEKSEKPKAYPRDEFVYHVRFESDDVDGDLLKLRSNHLRPRARTTLRLADVDIGSKVMVNYNFDEPTVRGYWYDAVATRKRETRTIKELFCTIFFGPDLTPLVDCKIIFCEEVFQIEKPGTQLNIHVDGAVGTPQKRQNKPECDRCLDDTSKDCKFCACHVCGGKNSPALQILCDECDQPFHIFCLTPPLEAIPEDDEWYCPLCKNDGNIIKAGEKLKESKKKSKMASAVSQSSRDWGKGMACAGRTKQCTLVPPNHFGKIPGVEVGTIWKFRVQVSEAGIHRPHVAGIHGREDEGSYSICLSGGYEDDEDNGETFLFTGSGGRDLSGNKRTAEQSCDQKLTRMNKALAKNCNSPLNDKTGAEAQDWKGGRPVRVVRNCKGKKHSKYAPEEGNRYDGIYKVVKYWPEKGQSGFLVWRYRLRRDDDSPAPWTKAGKARAEELGLVMQYPEGYLEAQEDKLKDKEEDSDVDEPAKGKRKKSMGADSSSETPGKKAKLSNYKLNSDIAKLIQDDTSNSKQWEEALSFTKEGGQRFIAKVEELFMCMCCQDVVCKPVTTSCQHNICKSCLMRSFKAEVYTCPQCRHELGKEYKMATNVTLTEILNKLLPGYESGR